MQGSSLKSSLWEFSFSMAKYNIETVLYSCETIGENQVTKTSNFDLERGNIKLK